MVSLLATLNTLNISTIVFVRDRRQVNQLIFVPPEIIKKHGFVTSRGIEVN